MPGIITRHFRQHNAIQFAESFSESAPTRYYYYIAKNTSYANTIQLTGTVKYNSSSNTIVGQGSLFTTELSVGDRVNVTGLATQLRVHSISTSQTFITAIRPATSNTVGANAYLRKQFSDSNPPTPVDSYQDTYYDIWRGMISLKKIQASDVSYVIPRYNWSNNTFYTQYTDINENLANAVFYVITSDYNVYKCIDNNRGANSTVKPTGTSTSIISTADNYRWKYMYTVSGANVLKFLNNDWIPVQTLSSNNGTAQWTVQQNAANGAIHHIYVVANGKNYLSTTNTFVAVSNSTTLKLSPSASSANDIYNGSGIFISSGLGAGQLRKIVNYAGSNNTITVNSAFTTVPNTSSSYIISPLVTVRGDSGGTANSRCTAYVSNTFGGQVRKITVISTGRSYSTANVTITANVGTGATAKAVISPLNGHGSDAVDELFGDSVMLDLRIAGNESNTFPTNNDFRVIGVLRDPLLANGSTANSSVIDQTTRITINASTGDFTTDEVITGQTSGAKARLVYFANTNAAKTQGVLKVTSVVRNGTGGNFQPGETLQGETSTVSANVVSVTKPALKPYSGLIIYNENRTSIVRAEDQTENIKIIVKF